MATLAAVTCNECGTALGGGSGKDPYKHLLHCLKVEPGTIQRMRDQANQANNEHSRRIIHILDAMAAHEVSQQAAGVQNTGGE